MRSIVVVFAVALGACAPFGFEDTEPAATDTDAVVKKDASPTKEPITPASKDDVPAPADTVVTPTTDLPAFPGSHLFKPAHTPAPAVVVLHGSEGGSDPAYRAFAQDLATRGFIVVAMCWFGCDGRPAALDRIPLESVADVGRFLKASPDTNGKVGVFGWGRGAEAALVVTGKAGTDPFDAVAVYGSTDVVVATPAGSPAWMWNNAAIANGARIPVESYLGPMLLAHGDEDTISPIERAENIADARERTRDMLITETELFAGEGHTLTKAGDTTRLRDRVAVFFEPHL